MAFFCVSTGSCVWVNVCERWRRGWRWRWRGGHTEWEGEEGGGDMESRFINVATPAKIQGVLLHPAVTGCARLGCHGNTALRACSRSFIQFWTEQRAAHRMHTERRREGERERGRERKTEKLLQSDQSKHFSDVVVSRQTQPSLHPPSDTHTHTHTHTHTYFLQ